MSSEHREQYTISDRSKELQQDPTFKEVVTLTLKRWPWVLLSLFVCLGLGVFWIVKTPKSYTENAQIVIKNDNEGSSTAVSSSISELGLFRNNANILNEIATMASPDVMSDVVKILNLETDYYKQGTFHNKLLYGSSVPVNVEFMGNSDNLNMSFKLNILSNNTYELSKLKVYDNSTEKWRKIKEILKGKFGEPLNTGYGTIIVNPTQNYKAKKDALELIVNKNAFKPTVNSYVKRVKISLEDDESSVIDMSLTDVSPERADEILAAIIAVYNENWIKEKNQVAKSTSEFINERIGVIEKELGNVDSDISSYKSENLIPNVEAVAQSYVDESQQLTQKTLELESELTSVRNLRSNLILAGDKLRALPTNTILSYPGLQMQIKDYNDILINRNNLISKSSEKNPAVKILDQQLEDIRVGILSSIDNSIQSLEGQIRGIQSARGAVTSKVASNPKQAKYLLSVERQQKVKENLYLFLLQKREDNELNQAFTAYNTRIIKKPSGDGTVVAPKSTFILFLSFLTGIFIPFGFNYIETKWNSKINSRKDLEGLKTPLIGEIPLASNKRNLKKNKDEAVMVVKNGSREAINEAFRVLRTNIEFTRVHKDKCNVLALTSFNPGSGKSFIAMNVAASMSLKGKRILVIDGDFRRGSSSAYVGNPRRGLSDYLSGQDTNIENFIVGYADFDNLYVLPIGHIPPNPTELIESPKFAFLIELLRSQYDYIIIDCPPIEVVADANIIDTVADRTIFIIRAGLLDKSLLKEIDKFYSEKKYKNLSVILNGTSKDKAAYGYHGSYGYRE